MWTSHKYAYISSFLSLPPTPSYHPSRSSQSTGLSSLCYTVTSHYLCVLHMVMLICIMNLQNGVFFQLLSCVRLFATSWNAAHQASLSFTISWRLLKLMSIELVMPSNHHVLCCLLHPLPSIFPSIRVFSNESALCNRWSKYWSLNFSISPSSEYSGLISFMIYWFDLLDQGDSKESSPVPQFKSMNSLALSPLYGPTLTSVNDYWKNCSFDYMDLCRQSNVSAL